MSTAIIKQDRGTVARQDFTGTQIQTSAETALAAVTARERALVEAHYLMAERHPRTWMDVRAAMLSHCSRPRFAEVSRYAKPIGKAKVNGQWVDNFARGFTVRFAETLSQEMGNIKPETSVTFEDDMIRIIRISVTDLEKNIPRSREVTIAKAVEKRGKKIKDHKGEEWGPPEGREVISVRMNSYNEPTYLVKATDDEMRNRVNSEESKTQRDLTYKLCPRDILEDCEDAILATMEKEDKRDPEAALKKLLDRFQEFGLMPSDLQTYIGRPVKQWTEADRQALRELGAAIRDGQTTFDEALKLRHSPPEEGEETTAEHDIRLQKQMAEQAARIQQAEEANRERDAKQGQKPITQADVDTAKAKNTNPQQTTTGERAGTDTKAGHDSGGTAREISGARRHGSETADLSDEENRALDAEIAERESNNKPQLAPKPAGFGMRRRT